MALSLTFVKVIGTVWRIFWCANKVVYILQI